MWLVLGVVSKGCESLNVCVFECCLCVVGYVYFFCLCLAAMKPSLAEGCNIIGMIEKFADILACFSCFTLHFVGKNSEKTNRWLKTLKKAWKISFFDKTNELRFLKGFYLFLLDRKHTKNTQDWIKRLPYMFFVEFFAALVKQYSPGEDVSCVILIGW